MIDCSECDRLRAIIEAIGEALGDLIEDVGGKNSIDWNGDPGVRVPASWGAAMRVNDDVYIAHLEAEAARVKAAAEAP